MNNSSLACVVPPDRMSGSMLIIVTCIGSIIAVVSIIGNGIIIVAFAKTKFLQKPANVLLTSLALSDLLYGLVSFPMYFVTDYFHYLHCDFFFAPFRIFILASLIFLSLNNIATIAFERFIGIQFPYFYQAHMTTQRSFILAVGSWSFAFARASFFAGNWFGNTRVAVVTELPILFILLLLTVIIYCRVYYISKGHLLRDAACGIKKQESKAQAAVFIAGINALSWVPVIVVRFVDTVIVDVHYGIQVTFLSPFVGTCFNLVIYTYRMSDYRRAIRRLLRRYGQIAPYLERNGSYTDEMLLRN